MAQRKQDPLSAIWEFTNFEDKSWDSRTWSLLVVGSYRVYVCICVIFTETHILSLYVYIYIYIYVYVYSYLPRRAS